MSKTELRDHMLPQLRALATSAIAAASASALRRLDALLCAGSHPALVAYAPIEWELDVSRIIESWLNAGATVAAPRAVGRGYELAVAPPLSEWITGRFGICEPPPAAPRLAAEAVRQAVWLVPGLAFDRRGVRLGRGAGYYDRLLANGDGLKIGLAHDFQVIDSVPSSPHDIRMDLIVTDRQAVTVSSAVLSTENSKE